MNIQEYLQLFCEIIYKNNEDGIYFYNDKCFYRYILDLYQKEKKDKDIMDYIIENYGLFFIVPSGNEEYNLKIIIEKKKNPIFHFDIQHYEILKNNIQKNILQQQIFL